MAKKESQLDHYQHSEIKVRLLKRYIEAYLRVIGHSQFFDEIHVYDLFCGEGIYPNGGKGSPIIITEAIHELVSNSSNSNLKKTKFYFTANDKDPKSIQTVKKYFEANSEKISWLDGLEIYNEDYKNFIPRLSELFSSFKRKKSFVFIDPYGYSDISLSDIRSLLKGNNSEVLLFLPTQFMYRFDNDAAPESLIRFTGELNPEWQPSSTGLDFIDKLKQGFKNQLRGYFVDTFIIAKSRNEYFCLFFFTSHIYGYHKMLEAKWSIDEEDGRGWVQGETQFDLFSQEKTIVNTTKFEREIREYLTEWRTNKELYKFTLEAGFLPKHVTPILKQLHSKNVLELTSINNTSLVSTSYYLTYDNYKSDVPAKIKFKYTKR